MQSIGVIGAGAWGTALAVSAGRAGRSVTLWGRDHKAMMAMTTSGEHRTYLPNIRLNPVPRVTGDMAQAMQADAVLIVLPAQSLRAMAPMIALHVRPHQSVVLCAKGIERGTGLLPSELMSVVMPQARLAVLSGPTFATEVAAGLPTAVTIASRDEQTASQLCTALSSRSFRCYASTDVLGVELGGALKNVLAIACGIVIGRGMGDNARAAILTRGLAELRRFGAALGAQSETLMGLSGMGDLVLTCTSLQSRNFALGKAIGEGAKLIDLTAQGSKLAEGLFTSSAVMQRAAQVGVELPICAAVDSILNNGGDIQSQIEALLSRPLKQEHA